MASEVRPTHEHECLLMVENPGFAKVQIRVKGLPHQHESNQQIRHEQNAQNTVQKHRLLQRLLVQFQVD